MREFKKFGFEYLTFLFLNRKKKIDKTFLIVQFTITFYLLLRFSLFDFIGFIDSKVYEKVEIVPHVSFLASFTVCFPQKFYIPTASQLKRMESVTRSPVFNHFSETVTGASVIRAYKVQERFRDESAYRVDRNMEPYYINFSSSRWAENVSSGKRKLLYNI